VFTVSVAMASYNGEKYIREQLDSIKNQTITPDEVIIVDDFSTDNTPKIIKEYIETNNLPWKFFENRENLGYIKNYFFVLSMVKGDVCFLCDQDDVWEKDKISKGISLFEDKKVFGVAMGFSLIDEKGQAVNSEIFPEKIFGFFGKGEIKKSLTKIELPEIMHRNIAPGCSCGYRKEVIDILLKKGNKNLPHDYQLSCISASMDGLFFLNEPLTKYRIHRSNTLGIKELNQDRLQIAEEKLSLSEVFCDYNVKVNSLCKKRYTAIKQKSLLKTLSLLFNKEYCKYYTLKERMGDIVYAIRK